MVAGARRIRTRQDPLTIGEPDIFGTDAVVE